VAAGRDRNVDGRAVALTVFSAMRWWGRVEVPLFFLYIRFRPSALDKLRRLSFIHAARWAIVWRLPGGERLRHPHLFFESNFNGGWEEYIDAFSYVIPTGMTALWGSSYGYPGSVPAGPFKAYIRENAIEASHYYSAYPEATATTVMAALELAPAVENLGRRAAGMSPGEFAAAWRALLTEHQACL
jgi:hypothetical protein